MLNTMPYLARIAYLVSVPPICPRPIKPRVVMSVAGSSVAELALLG
jgi:hypothetical protein